MIKYKQNKKYFNRLLCEFDKNKYSGTAKLIFIECRKYNLDIPEKILECLTVNFTTERKNLVNEHLLNIIKKSDKIKNRKEILLWFALNTETFEECYDAYRLETNEPNLEDMAIRKRLERYLDELIDSYLDTQFQKNKFPFEKPKKLTDKLELYASLTDDESD